MGVVVVWPWTGEQGFPRMLRMRVGINGFGRIGRLALRAGWGREDLEFVAVNEPHAPASTMAVLAEFDSVQGRWPHTVGSESEGQLSVDGTALAYTRYEDCTRTPWDELGVELVLECSGVYGTAEALQGHLDRGARRVVVSRAVKGGPPNLVLGVNDAGVDLAEHPIVTAASCTTNCLAPVVRVVHDQFGIDRGLITTIHDPTNTQRVVDAPHADPRRARAAGLNLVPTSSNSAYAVTLVIPELEGKLDSLAVRVPVLNASLVDATFQVSRSVTTEEVNEAFERAAGSGPLEGILGVENRPLVSTDFAGDPRSAIVDLNSTRVTDGSLLKVLAWYDNEWGYANRLVELAERVASTERQRS